MTTTASGPRVAIYTRISQKADDVDKVANQEARLRKIAVAQGFSVVDVFSDDGVSAWKDDAKRPGWDALQSAVQARQVDVVMVQNPDRFTRAGTVQSLLWLALCAQNGVDWWVEGQGLSKTSDPNADVMAFFAGRQANQESAVKSKRLRERYESDRAAGQHRGGGHRPFGWQRDGSLDPVEGPLLREAVASVIAGSSLVSVLKTWNSAGVLTPFGNPWTLKALGNVLSNPRLYGGLRHRGELVGEGTWETVCSRQDFDTLQTALATRKEAKRRTSSVQVQYLLSHVATCGTCGSVMIGRPVTIRGERTYHYMCRARRENAVPGDTRRHASFPVAIGDAMALDALVRALMMSQGSGDPDGVSEALSGLYARLAGIAEGKARVTELAMDPAFDVATLRKQAVALDADAAEVQEEIDRLLAASAEASLLVSAKADLFAGGTWDWDDAVKVKQALADGVERLTHDQRKGLVRAYLDIAVMPGRGVERFDIRHKVAVTLNEETG